MLFHPILSLKKHSDGTFTLNAVTYGPNSCIKAGAARIGAPQGESFIKAAQPVTLVMEEAGEICAQVTTPMAHTLKGITPEGQTNTMIQVFVVFRDEVRGIATICFEQADLGKNLGTSKLHSVSTYHLHAQNLKIIIEGADSKDPVMVYESVSREERYHGKSLSVEKTPVGTLYSAAIEIIPDLHSRFLTIVAPQANCPEDARSVSIETLAIETLSEDHFAGPVAIDRQIQTYKVVHLTGNAW
ncbi:MAG: hypothetical protein KKC20_18310 [Proteobacteria bacterium]|nr:hypothetical protein [Pseudomonadota bacterium]